MDKQASGSSREIATLGGGCFWCIEAVFAEVNGVEKAESGYAGGSVANPSYQLVCTGATGHAEVVQVTFDPQLISFREILTIFFTVHDPTTLNRQGADCGTQYRSVIFYHNDAQRAMAEQLIKELNQDGIWSDPIVTEVAPAPIFYKAEDYHQNYFQYNGQQPYCRAVVAPKVAKLRKYFSEKLKK
jgi:peptide-methionine (S)-S-oxide reductase